MMQQDGEKEHVFWYKFAQCRAAHSLHNNFMKHQNLSWCPQMHKFVWWSINTNIQNMVFALAMNCTWTTSVKALLPVPIKARSVKKKVMLLPLVGVSFTVPVKQVNDKTFTGVVKMIEQIEKKG
jgi:hypothetical protein